MGGSALVIAFLFGHKRQQHCGSVFNACVRGAKLLHMSEPGAAFFSRSFTVVSSSQQLQAQTLYMLARARDAQLDETG